jgi:superfamily II DNA or RNA helicase
MASTRTNKTRTKSAKKTAQTSKALSNLVCPNNITLEEWQKRLRVQEAEKSAISVEPIDDELSPGSFSVSGKSHRYKVVYYGPDSQWNFCSCMDYKTNGLGTCKHIERVRLYLSTKRTKTFPLPSYSSIYLSYHPQRSIKLRIGDINHDDMAKLATKYFKSDGSLRKGMERTIDKFVSGAKTIDSNFRIYPDAVDYIIQIREREARDKILHKYTDSAIDGLLKVPLYQYQRDGVRFAFSRGKSIIADEMGLGKTIQAIATAEMLRKEGYVESVMILCPTSLKYQWKKEIEKFTSATALVVEGDHLARTRAYQEQGVVYKIVSYHSIANDLKAYKSMDCDMLIMDEVQRLKNWNTQIAKGARLINTNYAVVLSGTPLENKLEELYSVMQFVDQFCLGPFYRFRNDTIVTSQETGKVIGYKNLNKVGKQISSVLLRRTKKQVALQMPARIDKILYVDMTDQQREIHDECQSYVARIIFKWTKYHFLSENDRKRLLLLMSKMRMVCDSTFIIDQTTNFQTKIDEALDIVNNTIESGEEKIVVFSQWERMARLLANELDKRGVKYEFLHGGVPSLKRRQLMDDFTDNPESRVFISTDAGSTGLNLQVASLLINLDLPWNPAVLEQRIARIYRIGQKRNIQVINMVSRGTIEERMLSTLNFKSEMFAGILDAGEDAIFLENSKFEKIVNAFAEVVEPIDDNETNESKETQPTQLVQNAVVTGEDNPKSSSNSNPNSNPANGSHDHANGEVPHSSSDRGTSPSSNEIINQGLNFFKGLSEILSDENKTKELVDTITRTDEATGETAIHIPVGDKEVVRNIFSTLSKLFSK